MSYSHGAVALVPVYLPPPVLRADPSNPTNAGMRLENGQAVFENDNYKITMGDNDTVNIRNKRTGETYEAWGDPHMKVDGQQAFDFWGRTTLKLDDGTEVDIHTTPMKDNPAATLSSRVVITAPGGKTWDVSGIDTNQRGDLSFRELDRHANRRYDLAAAPTNVLYENPNGKGFVVPTRDGGLAAVDQDYINRTDLVKGGAGQLASRYGEAFGRCSGLQSVDFLGMLLGALFNGANKPMGGPLAMSAMELPMHGMRFDDYFRRHQHSFTQGYDLGFQQGLRQGRQQQQPLLPLLQLSLQRSLVV